METARSEPIVCNEDKEAKAGESRQPASRTALCVRIWEYRGPQERLSDLAWQSDEQISELINSVAREAQGDVVPEHGNTLSLHFGNCVSALAAAKSLQVRLLTLQRTAPAAQAVAAAVVHNHAGEVAPGDTSVLTLANILVEADSAQILVTDQIYEAAKDIPGFAFNAQPVHPAGERGFAEPVYELLWTDESTYSHVRKAGMATKAEPATGASRYQIQSELGRGAMGVVYKAHDQVIGRTVALKTISIQQNFANSSELVERLKQEAKAAGGLDHPNIITIYDVGQEKDFVYLSMQFVEGQTLAALLAGREVPPLSTLLSYAQQICSAVGFAHQRDVIHRDLKPANFMLTNDGTVKVLDFGIAKLGDASLTQTGIVVGTPTYMAPEQATGKKLDSRSDIFSLGTVFYELFTREKPFKGDIPTVLYKLIHEDPPPPSVINPALPNGIDAIIRKALAKKPQDRYQSCEEMRDALHAQALLLEEGATHTVAAPRVAEPVTTRSAAAIRVHAKNSRQNHTGSVFALALLITAGAIAGWGYRVKLKTGALPPQLQRVSAFVHNSASQFGGQKFSDKRESAQTLPVAPLVESKPASAEMGTASANPSIGSVPVSAPVETAAAPSASDSHQITSVPPSIVAQPATTTQTQTNKTNPVAESPKASAVPPSEVQDPVTASADDNSAELADQATAKQMRRMRRRLAQENENNARVEGFSRADVPDLLRRADAAAGSGDYALARYEYGIVLRLDRGNTAARSGMARVIAARQERLQR